MVRHKGPDSRIQSLATAIDGRKEPKPVGNHMFLIDWGRLGEFMNESSQALLQI